MCYFSYRKVHYSLTSYETPLELLSYNAYIKPGFRKNLVVFSVQQNKLFSVKKKNLKKFNRSHRKYLPIECKKMRRSVKTEVVQLLSLTREIQQKHSEMDTAQSTRQATPGLMTLV